MHAAGRGLSIFPKAKWQKKGFDGREALHAVEIYTCVRMQSAAYLIGKSLFRHFVQPRPQISFLFLCSPTPPAALCP